MTKTLNPRDRLADVSLDHLKSMWNLETEPAEFHDADGQLQLCMRDEIRDELVRRGDGAYCGEQPAT